METTVLPNQHAVVTATANIVEQFIHDAPDAVLGLSGGSGPPHIHGALTNRDIAWGGVTAWMSDERWVPPDHDDSNQRMARETLVAQTGVTFLAPDTTVEDPHDAAARFETTLADKGVGDDRRSLIMLGMGGDGHTASLFPNTEALTVSDRSYVANWVAEHDTWRLTSTYGLIATADLVLIIVMGESKADMIGRVADGADVPVSHITCRGEVRWLLDKAAAAMLESR